MLHHPAPFPFPSSTSQNSGFGTLFDSRYAPNAKSSMRSSLSRFLKRAKVDQLVRSFDHARISVCPQTSLFAFNHCRSAANSAQVEKENEPASDADTKSPVTFVREDGTAARFYRTVSVGRTEEGKGGYTILLDSKKLKTPKGKLLILPNYATALAIAAEWEWQDSKRIKSITMPLMRLAATTIDQPVMKKIMIEHLVKYVETDPVVCRETDGNDISMKQKELFTPVVDWAERFLGVKLNISSSMFGSKQHPETPLQVKKYLHSLEPWKFTLADALITSCRSLFVGIALLNDQITVQEALAMSRIEEDTQIAEWGLVEGAHDLDQIDLRMKLLAAVNMKRLLKMDG